MASAKPSRQKLLEAELKKTSAYSSKVKKSLKADQARDLGTLDSDYKNSSAQLKKAKDQALQDAYISKELQKRDMGQALAASGLGGGYTESTARSLMNNYGNARNSATSTYDTNAAGLKTSHNANRAAVLKAYNDQLRKLEADIYGRAVTAADAAYANWKAPKKKKKSKKKTVDKALDSSIGQYFYNTKK